MTTAFGIKVLLEIGAILLIAYGYKNEEKLIEFEEELVAVLKFAFKKYVLKQVPNKNKQNRTKPANCVPTASKVNSNHPTKKSAKISNFPTTQTQSNVA